MQNILLIEDDSDVIGKVLTALNKGDYSVHIAENYTKAYSIALKKLPHLIICSEIIYDFEGDEILSQLRNETFISAIPFIFLLNEKNSYLKKDKNSPGLEYFIKKPFSATELLRIVELALEKYKTVFENSERKMNDLRGSISFSLPHEFFTPLNGILGFSEILVREFDNLDKHEAIQMLKYINKDAVRLKKLTENFLSFAQLEMIAKDEAKIISLRQSYFYNPKEAILSTAMQAAEEYGRKNDLILELDDAVIRISEGYIKKIITELIDNAFKFSERATPVFITLMSNDTSVMLSITDSGRGMTPAQISSVGAYMQFNRSLHEQQGSGLGLIISKKITELHGGEFLIESSTDEGTKIIMIFDN